MELVELNKICNISSGGTPSRKQNSYYGGNIKWAKISDLEKAGDGFIYETDEKITNSGLENIRNRIFGTNTLFLAMYGSVGKTAITKNKMSCNQAILGITAKQEGNLDLKFLKYWLDSKKKELLDSAKGVALKNLSAGMVKKLKIPLPPLETQKQIAQILDNAAALREKTQQLLAEYDQLAQSIFLDMFGDPVMNPKGWETKEIEDISTIVTKGSSPKWQGFEYLNEGVRFVTSENVRMGYLDCSKDKFVAKKFHEKLHRSQLKQNDLLVNLVGASIGRGALVTSDILPANINQAVAKIELKLVLINHIFLLNLIITPQMQERLIGNKVEGARANISLTNVRELRFIYPPIQLQNQFAEKIALIEQQKDLAKQELQESEDLFQALLQKAFKGELV